MLRAGVSDKFGVWKVDRVSELKHVFIYIKESPPLTMFSWGLRDYRGRGWWSRQGWMRWQVPDLLISSTCKLCMAFLWFDKHVSKVQYRRFADSSRRVFDLFFIVCCYLCNTTGPFALIFSDSSYEYWIFFSILVSPAPQFYMLQKLIATHLAYCRKKVLNGCIVVSHGACLI